MGRVPWREVIGWSEEQLEDVRYLAYSYIRQGKYDIGISFFEALVALDPDNSYDIQTLGALYLQINEAEKALKCLNKALMIETDHAPTLLNLTKALFMLGKKEEGLKLAHILKKEVDPAIANVAKALILAYE